MVIRNSDAMVSFLPMISIITSVINNPGELEYVYINYLIRISDSIHVGYTTSSIWQGYIKLTTGQDSIDIYIGEVLVEYACTYLVIQLQLPREFLGNHHYLTRLPHKLH